MKREDILLFLVSLFISVVLFCLTVNGDQPEDKSPDYIDSQIKRDTIKDVCFLTKNFNKNEETNFSICTVVRNNVCLV